MKLAKEHFVVRGFRKTNCAEVVTLLISLSVLEYTRLAEECIKMHVLLSNSTKNKLN
jgi:hypothetical protein